MEERVPLSFGDLARVVGGRIVGGSAAAPIGGVSIDSRALGPGDLFVAIRGDRFDGHRFVNEAVSAGAVGALVSDESALEPSLAAVGVVVDDTLRALHTAGWAPAQLFFILGADAFAEIATWHELPFVLDATNFAVIARPGTKAVPQFG